MAQCTDSHSSVFEMSLTTKPNVRTDLQVVASGTCGGNIAMIRKQLHSIGVPTWDEIGADMQCLVLDLKLTLT